MTCSGMKRKMSVRSPHQRAATHTLPINVHTTEVYVVHTATSLHQWERGGGDREGSGWVSAGRPAYDANAITRRPFRRGVIDPGPTDGAATASRPNHDNPSICFVYVSLTPQDAGMFPAFFWCKTCTSTFPTHTHPHPHLTLTSPYPQLQTRKCCPLY